jgi:hypothetical protein
VFQHFNQSAKKSSCFPISCTPTIGQRI